MREVPPKETLQQLVQRAASQNLVERCIAWRDPVRALERMRARVAMAVATGGAYTGASQARRALAAWRTHNHSADGALLADLPTLRDRSRDLQRNNPLASGAVNTVVTRVVGTGLALQPAVDHEALGITRDRAAAWQRDVKRRWEMWAERTWCDATDTQTFYGLQSLALRAALEAGDVFAVLPLSDDRDRPSALMVKLIEGERVTNPVGERDRPTLAAGVEMDADGRAVAYHVLRQHPGTIHGATRTTDRIERIGPASGRRQVLHIYDPRRPGQTRGVPYLAPVMEPLKQLGRYTDAEIDRAVVSAFFTVFFTHESGEAPDVMASAASGEQQSTDARQGESWNGELSSGLAVDLPTGSDVKFADPNSPNQAFDPFVQAVLRQVGASLEIPFELLIKHFTSSYTAARGALLDFWLFVRGRREWMASTFCQPVYEEWLRLEVVTGRIAAPGYTSSALARHTWSGAYWVGDSMGVLDPQREANAVEKYLELGLTTRAKESMKLDGASWEDNHEQLVREHTARRAGGLGTAPRPAPPAPRTRPDPNEDEDEDDTDDET